MAFKHFTVSNVSTLANGDSAAITGKNGFLTRIGQTKLLVEDYSLIDGDSNLVLKVANLYLAFDENFSNHILDVNDGFFGDLKGTDHVTIPVNEKANTGNLLDFVGFNPRITEYSANIVAHNISANTLTFSNEDNNGTKLSDVLEDTPFYITLPQILHPEYFVNKEIFLKGSERLLEKNFNIQNQETSYTADIGVVPRVKKAIRVWVDGEEINESDFTWDNKSNITLAISASESLLRTRVNYYTVPAIERGDNISVYSENVYSVLNVSYDPSDAKYNANLTVSQIYKIYLSDNITANLSGFSAINESLDLVGEIGNVYLSNNTFTLDYDSSNFPGLFNLTNNKIYSIQAPLTFDSLVLPSDKLIKGAIVGTNIVRARNKNSIGKRSEWVTKDIDIKDIPIKKVKNLEVTEGLYRDTAQGVGVRVTISFDHILDQEVTDYEISYKLIGDIEDLDSFNTVKVSANGVDTDGKIRFTINNVDRGRTVATNTILVRVTPLNKSIRGITAEKSESVIGKSAKPQNIIAITGGQEGLNLIFTWKVPTNSDGTVVDLDLNEILIRKVPGTISASSAFDSWVGAEDVATVSTPATSVTLGVTSFGTFTYLFRTRDTSGNESETVASLPIFIQRPPRLNAFLTWSEDNPGGNVVIGFPNANRTENNYPSFTESINGGLSLSDSSPVDNANGTSSGFSVVIGNPTDLAAFSGDAFYQTQIRDVGLNVTGQIFSTTNGNAQISTLFTDLKNNVLEGVTDSGTQDNVFVEVDFGGIGHILGFNNSEAATVSYNSQIGTLTSGGLAGNVYAIWNSGQFDGDVSNANSWALIAGVINANAIELGNTFYANGISTGGNNFANSQSTNIVVYSTLDITVLGNSNPTGMFINDDGNFLFTTDNNTKTIRSFDLSESWNVSTKSHNAVFNVINDSTDPRGLFFRPEGNVMYIIESFSNSIISYELSDSWNILSAVKSNEFSISNANWAISFKPDGTKMYKSRITHVHEYDLSTPWQVNTASLVNNIDVGQDFSEITSIMWNPSGEYMILGGNGYDLSGTDTTLIRPFQLSDSWNIASFSNSNTSIEFFNSETSDITSAFVKNDGNTFYITSGVNSSINASTIITKFIPGDPGDSPYNPSRSTNVTIRTLPIFYVGTEQNSSEGIFFKDDGTKLYVAGPGPVGPNRVYEYDLAESWNIATAVANTNLNTFPPEAFVRGMFFRSNGSNLFVIGNQNDLVVSYAVPDAWNIASAVQINAFSVSDYSEQPRAIHFSTSGDRMFITDTTTENVTSFTLSTPWQVNTATVLHEVTLSPTEDDARGIFFSPDGFSMYIGGDGSDNVFTYDLSESWNVATATLNNNFYIGTNINRQSDIFLGNNGNNLFIIESNDTGASFPQNIFTYHLSESWNVETATNTVSIISDTENISMGYGSDINSLFIRDDGNLAIFIDEGYNSIRTLDISNTWEIGSATDNNISILNNSDNSFKGFFVRDEGNSAFVIGNETNSIISYELSDIWNFDSALKVNSFSVNEHATSPAGITFKTDGTKLYITDLISSNIIQYDLSTAWQVNSSTFADSYTIDEEIQPKGLSFSDDGFRLFITGNTTNNVYTYDLSEAWNISTTSDNVNHLETLFSNVSGLFANTTGNTFFVIGNNRIGTFVTPDSYNVGAASNQNVSNFTGTSYALVDLQQFVDETGSLTFQGNDNLLDVNLEFRYASQNVFFANGNVNSTAFTDGDVNEGWKPYTSATRQFRYFQLRFNIENDNPDQVGYILDEFFYSVDLEDKIFKTQIEVNSSPQQVLFTPTDFIEPPLISLTVASDENLVPVVLPGWTTTAANINVYNNTGSAVTGVNVIVTAIGV